MGEEKEREIVKLTCCCGVQTVQGLKELYDTTDGPANQTALEIYGIELPGNLTSLTPPGEPANRYPYGLAFRVRVNLIYICNLYIYCQLQPLQPRI